MNLPERSKESSMSAGLVVVRTPLTENTDLDTKVSPSNQRPSMNSNVPDLDAIGPVVDYHGPRQPCFIQLHRMLLRASEENLETWKILTNHGSRSDAIRQMPALCN